MNILQVHSQKGPGVIITSNISWSDHISWICRNAYFSFNLIRRSISKSCHVLSIRKTLYIALVILSISYYSQLWRPQLKRDVVSLERVQRRATKFILQDYSSNYKIRLTYLSFLPLMYWFELHNIMFLVTSLKNPSDNFNILDYISYTSTVI